MRVSRTLIISILTIGASMGASVVSYANDLMLAATRPSRLHVIDLTKREVVKHIDIPSEPGAGPLTIVPAPDGKRAYVLVNRWGSISGIDLESGEEVFRADLSSSGERVINTFALEVSRDGKELYVFESPVKLGLGAYEVQDTRISVYDTASGKAANPVRSFKAPRQISMLMMSVDNKHLYGVGRDLYDFDPKSGEILKTIKLQSWDRTDVGAPDVLAIWPQFEQSNIFATPYLVEDKGTKTWMAGQMMLDLATGKLEYKLFEEFKAILFSSVVNPKNRNETYTVYTTLSKIDMSGGGPEGRLVQRVELPHTYYTVNISEDGEELYVGGTQNDIGVYSSKDLSHIATIKLPGGGDQQLASVRIIKR